MTSICLEAFYLYYYYSYYYKYYCYCVPPFNLALGTRDVFYNSPTPWRAAGVVHMAALKNPHVQCPKKLDVVVVVAVEPQSVSQSSPSPACDIIQARCNDVDNETMDSSTHTPTAPIRLEDKRRFTLSQNTRTVALMSFVLSLVLSFSHWHFLLATTTPRTRPQIARHIIIVVFNLCAPKEIANTACPALSAALQT